MYCANYFGFENFNQDRNVSLWSVFIDCDDVCCRMSFEDFCRYFTSIDICHMINTSLISLSKTWKEDIVEGEWKRNRCGGCANNRTFLENPQVRMLCWPNSEFIIYVFPNANLFLWSYAFSFLHLYCTCIWQNLQSVLSSAW